MLIIPFMILFVNYVSILEDIILKSNKPSCDGLFDAVV